MKQYLLVNCFDSAGLAITQFLEKWMKSAIGWPQNWDLRALAQLGTSIYTRS